jgi:hypothetical protein
MEYFNTITNATVVNDLGGLYCDPCPIEIFVGPMRNLPGLPQPPSSPAVENGHHSSQMVKFYLPFDKTQLLT